MSLNNELELSNLLFSFDDILADHYIWSENLLSQGINIDVNIYKLNYATSTNKSITFENSKAIFETLLFKKINFSFQNASKLLDSTFPIEDQFPFILIFDLDNISIDFYSNNKKINEETHYNFLDNSPQIINFTETIPYNLTLKIQLKNPTEHHRLWIKNYLLNKETRINTLINKISYQLSILYKDNKEKELEYFNIPPNLKSDYNNLKNLIRLPKNDLFENWLYFLKLSKLAQASTKESAQNIQNIFNESYIEFQELKTQLIQLHQL